MNLKGYRLLLLLCWLSVCSVPRAGLCAERFPEGFVDVKEVIPSVLLDIRYYGCHNFLGERVDGYRAPKCILTKEAAKALADVQEELSRFSLSLKLYDCYRPQRAVDHFVRWAKAIDNTRNKEVFYPTVDKKDLFRDGYIDTRSGHSRGSAVDLTIVPVPVPIQAHDTPEQTLYGCHHPAGARFHDSGLDMGTGFDCFHELSHTANPAIGIEQKKNRLLLKSIMEKHGFRNFEKEWWHYTMKNEPFTETYFDFIIE
jgi:zinc D-Ala-D-Ala dipeptidase